MAAPRGPPSRLAVPPAPAPPAVQLSPRSARLEERRNKAALAASLGVPILAKVENEDIIRFSDLYPLAVSVRTENRNS